VIAIALLMLIQGPAANDVEFQREQTAYRAYAACLNRENDRRRATGSGDLSDMGKTCKAERGEIVRLGRRAGRPDDSTAARLKGFEDQFRLTFRNRNKPHPATN